MKASSLHLALLLLLATATVGVHLGVENQIVRNRTPDPNDSAFPYRQNIVKHPSGLVLPEQTLRFETNLAPSSRGGDFFCRTKDSRIVLDSSGLEITVADAEKHARAVRVRFLGADPTSKGEGANLLKTVTNYLLGPDPSCWRRRVPNYSSVIYKDVYPGISVTYYGKEGHLEYDFALSPGASVDTIGLEIEGADVKIDQDGSIIIATGAGEIRHSVPTAYQLIDGEHKSVESRYVLRENNTIGIEVNTYDPNAELIIDPSFTYSTYLGGSAAETIRGAALDDEGNVYVIGTTESTDLPTTPGVLQPNKPGEILEDVFVAKLDPSGGGLVYSTYLGGDSTDVGNGIAIDDGGHAYVTGFTFSLNFPVTPGAIQTSLSPSGDAFVAKLSPSGDSMVYSTLLGGVCRDEGKKITVDELGFAYVAGVSCSRDFPTVNAFQPRLADGAGSVDDAFVSKLNPSGTGLVFSTYLGGTSLEDAVGVGVDGDGNVFVGGTTDSSDFPVTAGSFQTSLHAHDAFVAKLNSTGETLIYSTYLGGTTAQNSSGRNEAKALTVDSQGFAYVAGSTSARDFPTTPGALKKKYKGGNGTGFVTKLSRNGRDLVYSTYFGTDDVNGETVLAIASNSGGELYVTGITNAATYPVTDNAIQPTYGGGNSDAFIAKLNSAGTALIYSSFLGGGGGVTTSELGLALAVNSEEDVVVAGLTSATDFPTTAGAFQGSKSGSFQPDGFVALFRFGPVISGVSVSGKKLIVTGQDFDDGAQVIVDDEPKRTRNDSESPTSDLIAKKAGKKIQPGASVRVRVRNANGTLSNEVVFTRPL